MAGDFNTGYRRDKALTSPSSSTCAFNRHSSIPFQSGEPSSSNSSYVMYPMQQNSVNPRNCMPANLQIINNNAAPIASTGISGGGMPLSSIPGLNPDVELAVEWSPEEQLKLEEGLAKYAEEPHILKYIKIAAALPEKTVRDVALRCRWMTRKENGKRRKQEETFAGKKLKDRKEKPESSSKTIPPAPSSNVAAYSLLMNQLNDNNLMPCEALGSTTQHLLEENFQVFSSITANLTTFKIQENVDLLFHTRDNIRAILNDMRMMPGIMSQMPPLPVSMNEELANIILPNPTQAMMFGSPSGIYQNPEPRC